MTQRTGLALAGVYVVYTLIILAWSLAEDGPHLEILGLLVVGLPLAGLALWWSARSGGQRR